MLQKQRKTKRELRGLIEERAALKDQIRAVGGGRRAREAQRLLAVTERRARRALGRHQRARGRKVPGLGKGFGLAGGGALLGVLGYQALTKKTGARMGYDLGEIALTGL